MAVIGENCTFAASAHVYALAHVKIMYIKYKQGDVNEAKF